uniref:F5/8 type C domain-containing protein n=1 Tax=Globisporangium ultimum (strain ATCC 200006 / CBS 805.95 / DAOM BR144) TaxID=431595 RepID=K3WJU3_GLOUD
MTRSEDALGTVLITRELTRATSFVAMTVSNSTVSSSTALRLAAITNFNANTTTTTAAVAMAPSAAVMTTIPPVPSHCKHDSNGSSNDLVKSHMRMFAVIICNDCLYLEFPGCDVHGVLYTERVVQTEAKDKDAVAVNRSKLHAKCPECSAATNNVRPFRDGCRRCKGTTTVYMWCSTLQEIAQAHEAFPVHAEEIEHTALVCDICQSVVFPRAREVLTKRTVDELLMSSNGKPLKVSNFQLSMPHVEGCSRKGMPVKTAPIQIPKSELKFVHDRIDKCPIAPRIQGGPQYRKRHSEVITQQNHLHQIYIRLLHSIVKTFDSNSPSAVDPLQKVLTMFEKMKPLALFNDWSPPRQLSTVTVTPTRVLSSSDFDKEHGAHRILESGYSFWRSAVPSSNKQREEWLNVQFSFGVTLSAITLVWHPDYIPSRYSIGVSADGSFHETVAIVVDGAKRSQIALAKHQGRTISSLKITLLSTKSSSAGENSLLDRRIIQEMTALLRDGDGAAGIDTAYNPNAVHPFKVNGNAAESVVKNEVTSSTSAINPDEHSPHREDPISTAITLSVVQAAFAKCIKRRSQMKRMQRTEELTGKKEDDMMQLEEPFSLEVCPEFFDLSHRILSYLLSPWLSSGDSVRSQEFHYNPEFSEEEKESENDSKSMKSAESPMGFNLYKLLNNSFAEFRATVAEEKKKSANTLYRMPSTQLELLFSPDGMCVALLQTITSNIRRLVLSRVDPSDIGIEPASIHNGDNFLSAPPALEPMVSTLEQLISLGAKRNDRFFAVSLKAAAAVEVGMEAFYPSAQQRTKLLTSRMGRGAILEVQVRWPVQERDQEDPRYERLILMLQFECIKRGLKHAIRGSWYFFMHLIVEVPASEQTQSVLTEHFATCIQQAGFSSWQVVAGAQEISINLQRHLHWDRVEKMSHDSGAGWIRVYPRDVALFEDVLADVEHFLLDHDKRDTSKMATRSCLSQQRHDRC